MNTSKILQIGDEIPDFRLYDIHGYPINKENLIGAPAALVAFINNDSHHVNYIREVFLKMVWEYHQRGESMVAINSGIRDIAQDQILDLMRAESNTFRYFFPYLLDANNETTKEFGSSDVPDFFVFDRLGKLTYHGSLDDSFPDSKTAVTGNQLRRALNATLLGEIPFKE